MPDSKPSAVEEMARRALCEVFKLDGPDKIPVLMQKDVAIISRHFREAPELVELVRAAQDLSSRINGQMSPEGEIVLERLRKALEVFRDVK